MIKMLFLSMLEISLATGPIILLLVMLAPFLSSRYAAKWKYWIWIVLAVRLLIPFGKTESEPLLVIDMPRQITTLLVSHDTVESALISGGEAEMLNLHEDEQELSAKMQMPRMSVGITPLDFAAVVWLMGGLAMLSVHGFSYVHFKRQVVRNGVFVEDSSILCLLQQLTEELQIRRKIVIMKYSRAAGPMIIGFIRPILIMPDETYSREELYFILKHELVHMKRHDIYFKLLLLAVNALHWFNPAVWLMRREAAVDMELSCDESVVRGMNLEVRKAYTETLLSALYREYARRIVLSTQFYGGKHVMKKRFKNILVGTKKKNGFSLVVCVAALTLALGSLVGCSIEETSTMELSEETASEENEIENTETEYSVGTVKTDTGALRVRGESDIDATVIGLLPDGAEVTIMAGENEFYKIIWQQDEEDDTIVGYVRKEYVDVE